MRLFTLGILLCILLVPTAFAAVSVEQTNASLLVDYSDFTDDNQEFLEKTVPLTLGSTEPTDTAVTVRAQNLPTSYRSADFTTTIPANGSITISYPIRVPHDLDAGEENIGTIGIFNAQNALLISIPLTQITESMLELKDFDVSYVDETGKKQKDNFDGDDQEYELDEKVGPGQAFTIELILENRLDRDYDRDKRILEDVIVTMEVDDEDLFGTDEEEYDLGDIDAEDKETLVIELEVQDDAPAGDYTLDFTFETDDGQGSTHRFTRSLTLEVERKRNDLRITKAVITPDRLTCQEEVRFDLTIRNFGTRDQDHAAIAVFNDALGINENLKEIAVERFDDDDTFEHTFTFPVKNPKVGNYRFDVLAYMNVDDLADQEAVTLAIAGCTTESAEVQEISTTKSTAKTTGTTTAETDEVITAVLDTNSSPTPSSTTPISTVEDPFAVQNLLLVAMLLAIVVIIALIALLFVILLK